MKSKREKNWTRQQILCTDRSIPPHTILFVMWPLISDTDAVAAHCLYSRRVFLLSISLFVCGLTLFLFVFFLSNTRFHFIFSVSFGNLCVAFLPSFVFLKRNWCNHSSNNYMNIWCMPLFFVRLTFLQHTHTHTSLHVTIYILLFLSWCMISRCMIFSHKLNYFTQ